MIEEVKKILESYGNEIRRIIETPDITIPMVVAQALNAQGAATKEICQLFEPKPIELIPPPRFDEVYYEGLENMDKPDEDRLVTDMEEKDRILTLLQEEINKLPVIQKAHIYEPKIEDVAEILFKAGIKEGG